MLLKSCLWQQQKMQKKDALKREKKYDILEKLIKFQQIFFEKFYWADSMKITIRENTKSLKVY